MIRTLIAGSLSLFSLFCVFTVAHAETEVSGTLAGDTTWTLVESPYVVTGDIIVPVGTTLTVEPGVVVRPGQDKGIFVEGSLLAEGTESAPIFFTSRYDDAVGGDTNGDGSATTPNARDWRHIHLSTGTHGTFRYVTVRYGGMFDDPMPMTGIKNEGGEAILDHVTLTDNGFDGFNQTAGSSVISHSRFARHLIGIMITGGTSDITDTLVEENSTGLAVYSWTGTSVVTVASSTFTNNAYGIDASNVQFTLHNSRIVGNNTAGLYGYSENDSIDATNNWWGSASGPAHENNPAGTGSPVIGGALFDPWLTVDPNATTTPEEPTPTCAVDCYSNVMFLPGLMGSRLYDATGEIIWLSEDDTEADSFRMNSDGTSASLGITTYDALETADGQQLYTDIYKSFLAEMKNWERDYHITATTTPYDWRLNYDDVVNRGRKLSNGRISYLVPPEAGHDPYLLETLKQLASSSPTGKVTIIGHSQGGLVAKALMQKIGAEATAQLVDKVILVASPQLGTPKAVGVLLHGFDGGILGAVSNKKIRELGQTMQSAYNLLPSENYFTRVDDPVVIISSSTLPVWNNAYGDFIHWNQGMYNFMSDTPGLRTKPGYSDLDNPEIVGESFLENARTTHNALDAWVPPSGVQLITIAGWGKETLSGLTYTGIRDCVRTEEAIILGRRVPYCAEYQQKLTLKPNLVINGDGTVVEPSAHWASGAVTTRYWVNLPLYNGENLIEASPKGRDHKNILEVPELRTLIGNIITGTTTPLYYISSTAPEYIGGDDRLHFTLHSPLTLGFIDVLGNYTGATATGTLSDIPGVQYERFGEVQWLSVPKYLAGQLVMRGTSSGSFTLDIEEVNGNAILSNTSFEGIPSSTSTVVTMDISPTSSVTGSSTLLVDEDGDGMVDITLEAIQDAVVLPPVPTLDAAPPITTASTTGTLGTYGWYMSNVIVTLSATDTESGVASTTYSLNNGATWTEYTAPVTVATEGFSTVLYHSTDNSGNSEATSTLSIKIDKTAPEAQISVSTSTQDLFVDGVDALGTTTVSKDTAGNYTITDQAGHTTKLFFQKTFTGARLTYAKLTGIQYDQAPKTTLPSSSFLYVWDSKVSAGPVSQTIAVDGTYLLQASYDKRLNKTVVIVLKKGVPIQTKTFTGLKIVRLTTQKGVVGYGL